MPSPINKTNMETIKCKTCGRELPEVNFKLSRWGGRVKVCTDCATMKRHNNSIRKKKEAELELKNAEIAAKDKEKRLEQFTPRELMKELSKRGYKGKLFYTQEIDISNF